MKALFPFLPETWVSTACKKASLYYTIAVSLIALTALGSLSSCQRAPQAYFAPTPHPAYHSPVVSSPVATPTPDASASASRNNTPDVSARPVWDVATAVAPPAPAEAAIATVVRKATVWDKYKRLLPRKPAPPQCDQIVLRNGDVIEAKVKEVGVNEIRYKKCDRQDGPDYTISKRDVLSIKYSNGEVERFTSSVNSSQSYGNSGGNRQSYDSPTSRQNDGPRTDPFAIVAIATGGLAILTGYGAFLLGAAAVVFGALSLSRIRREPNRFKGRGLAMAGMIAGIVAAAYVILYLYVL